MKVLIFSAYLFFAQAVLKSRTWDEVKVGMEELCSPPSPNMRYCPLITEGKDFLDACPEVIESIDAALTDDEKIILQRYLRSYIGALRSVGRKPITEKDATKRKRIEKEEEKKREKLTEEQRDEQDWEEEKLKPFADAITQKLTQKAVGDVALLVCDSILHMLERVETKQRRKTKIDYLIFVEKIFGRLLMLRNRKREELADEDVEKLKKASGAIEECRPMYQRNIFIVGLTLGLLAVMSPNVLIYLIKAMGGAKH